jgi:hypothetical protein
MLLEQQMRSSGLKVNAETFKQYGKELKLFKGVNEWFAKIKDFRKKNNIEVQHYIISSGLSDVIKGCAFIKDINNE